MLITAYCLAFPDGKLAGRVYNPLYLKWEYIPVEEISLVRFWNHMEIEIARKEIKDNPEKYLHLMHVHMDIGRVN